MEPSFCSVEKGEPAELGRYNSGLKHPRFFLTLFLLHKTTTIFKVLSITSAYGIVFRVAYQGLEERGGFRVYGMGLI